MWQPDDVLEVLVNPVYTGIGEYPQIVPDETWVKAVSQVIQDVGTETVLVIMLRVLRDAFPS